MAISDDDLERLGRCVVLARAALQADHHTRHPEFAIARWAVDNLTAPERARATGYTSGEHCPMCAAAHAWVGLGRVVYAASSQRLRQWPAEWGSPPPPVAALPINTVAPALAVDGPAPQFTDSMKVLYEAKFRP